MKKAVPFFLFSFLALALYSQSAATRLIIRGDDMGFSHASNVACLETYKNGMETSVEVMVVTPWFPETVQMLKENPGLDVGLHLAITSEWDNLKWRPLTHCPSLTTKEGYFFPMIWHNPNYPGLAIMDNDWKLEEVEQEFRAQIELTLQQIPHLSHISGHMGCMNFDPRVSEMVRRLAAEYQLADVSTNPVADYGISYVTYDGPKKTYEEKEASFIRMLDKLESGKTYLFLDHPALDNTEMQAVHHIGYEDVAMDRQGVTDLFVSEKVKAAIREKGIELVSYNEVTKALPRSTPEAEGMTSESIDQYLKAVKESGQELHSLMVLRHGKVIAEHWLGDHAPDKNHVMHSVSKTFTATAIGFAVAEGRLKVSDKVISFFPEYLLEEVSPYLAELDIRHLLTMTVGHHTDPTSSVRNQDNSWEQLFLATPIEHQPGTKFVYNSLASYMLAAIVQRVSGEKLLDYLYPRLLRPLGIVGAEWTSSPSGVNSGGWGLYIKTEDMAKMGQFLLQKGRWQDRQLLPEAWFDEATAAFSTQPPVWITPEMDVKSSDWVQGYGYQLWRCRHNAFRADGAEGQFIIVLPDQDAVIVTTAKITKMQEEINLIWAHLLGGME